MRLNGGVIGASNQPTNRVAPGVWSAEELRTNQLYGRFPRYYEGWDLTYLVNTTPSLVSTTALSGIGSGSGIDFKPDGTRMYVLDSGLGGELAEFALSTAWDSSTASLSSVSGDTGLGQGVALRSDGRAFFAVGTLSPSVRMHIMTTPWAASTAVFGNFVSITAEDTSATGLAFSTDGTNMYVLGDTGNDVNQYSLDPAWAVSTATYVRNFSVADRETFPRGITFKPDGTVMYVIGSVNDDVLEYSLSTAWNISTASYVRAFDTTAQDTEARDVKFNDDGTKMYTLGATGDEVNEYSLSTAWNVSTASFVRVFSVTGQETEPTGLFFKSDGSRMYVLGQTGDDVNEYSLSTPWDISTASFVRNQSIATEDTSPHGLAFNDDGTRMYVLGQFNGRVYEYNLSTAWDISTETYATLLTSQVPTPNDIYFKPDGTKMYTMSNSTDLVYEYDLSSAWDIFTASLATTLLINTVTSTATGLTFSSDGLAMYLCDATRVYRFDLGTAWDIDTAVYSHLIFAGSSANGAIAFDPTSTRFYISSTSDVYQYVGTVPKAIRSPGDEGVKLSVSAQESNPTDLTFSPDGTRLYVSGDTGDDVNQYSLSTAWDLSTATYVQNFSVTAQETVPAAVQFKSDGTRMYVVGSAGDDVNEYSLSTAWDISTATYVQLFSIAGQESGPTGLAFKPDGTRMYVIGTTGDDVNEYSLSTAWDISTASFVRVSSSLGAQDGTPQTIAFRPDGARMYMLGQANDTICEYSLSTPWDVSSLTFIQSFPIAYTGEGGPTGLAFKADGTKLYFIGSNTDTIYELNLG